MSNSRTFALAIAILVWAMLSVASALACDGDRYPCPVVQTQAPDRAEPLGAPLSLRSRPASRRAAPAKPGAHVERTAGKPAPATDGRAASADEAVSSDETVNTGEQEPAQQSQAAAIRVFDTPFTDKVRVYANDDVSELDMRAAGIEEVLALAGGRPEPEQPANAKITIAPVKVVQTFPQDPLPQDATTAAPAQEPADASLLQRIFITFGSAFGAASAIRLFIG
jgi:hypothetical protein